MPCKQSLTPSCTNENPISSFRFSNRPVGVKRFQAIHGCSVDVTRGVVLLYGIAPWDSKTRWNDLLGGLAVGRSKRTYELTSSIVPRGTPFHRMVELGYSTTCDQNRCIPETFVPR